MISLIITETTSNVTYSWNLKRLFQNALFCPRLSLAVIFLGGGSLKAVASCTQRQFEIVSLFCGHGYVGGAVLRSVQDNRNSTNSCVSQCCLDTWRSTWFNSFLICGFIVRNQCPFWPVKLRCQNQLKKTTVITSNGVSPRFRSHPGHPKGKLNDWCPSNRSLIQCPQKNFLCNWDDLNQLTFLMKKWVKICKIENYQKLRCPEVFSLYFLHQNRDYRPGLHASRGVYVFSSCCRSPRNQYITGQLKIS